MLEHEPPEGRRRIAGMLIGLVVILACIFVVIAVMGTNAAKRTREANARAAAQVEVKFAQDPPQPRSAWSVGRIAPNPMETYPSWAAHSTLERPMQGKLQWLRAEISYRCRRRDRDFVSLGFKFPANSPQLRFDTRTAEFISGDTVGSGFRFPVRTRWDGGDVVTFYFLLDDDGVFRPTVFSQKPFIGRLRSHREVVIEVDFRAEGRVHFRWSLQGSSDAISEAQRECAG